MKLIHLSDLHLGKRVNEVSMTEDQSFVLEQILQIVAQEAPDGVLIAGDVYDKSVPPGEAVTLLDGFLYRLSRMGIPTMIISGNHDSPERLAFGGRLMSGAGIYVAPVYQGQVEPVTLTDAFGPVDIWLLPFLKPVHVRRAFPEKEISSYTEAMAAAIDAMQIDPERRNVLVTHQFVLGSVRCESEEVSVGGTDGVDAAVFAPFDYVALGHLHGPQNVGSNKIRYCGTPLKYSFSETDHYKSVTVVELGHKGDLTVRLRPLEPRHDLRQIRGTFQELTDKSFYGGTGTEDYLHVILTDEEDVLEAVGRLRQVFPNLMKLSYDNARTRADSLVEGAREIQRKSPLTLFGELYEEQNGQPMTEDQKAFVRMLAEKIWEDGL